MHASSACWLPRPQPAGHAVGQFTELHVPRGAHGGCYQCEVDGQRGVRTCYEGLQVTADQWCRPVALLQGLPRRLTQRAIRSYDARVSVGSRCDTLNDVDESKRRVSIDLGYILQWKVGPHWILKRKHSSSRRSCTSHSQDHFRKDSNLWYQECDRPLHSMPINSLLTGAVGQ